MADRFDLLIGNIEEKGDVINPVSFTKMTLSDENFQKIIDYFTV